MAKAKPAPKEVPSLIVASKVKEYFKGKDLRTSADAVDAINAAVVAMLDKAAERCDGNGRKTVNPADL